MRKREKRCNIYYLKYMRVILNKITLSLQSSCRRFLFFFLLLLLLFLFRQPIFSLAAVIPNCTSFLCLLDFRNAFLELFVMMKQNRYDDWMNWHQLYRIRQAGIYSLGICRTYHQTAFSLTCLRHCEMVSIPLFPFQVQF